jgi:hypothetical protein
MSGPIPTWEDVERAVSAPYDSRSINPSQTVLHHAVTLVRRGDLTREEALRAAVLALLEIVATQQRQIGELVNTTPPLPQLFYVPYVKEKE